MNDAGKPTPGKWKVRKSKHGELSIEAPAESGLVYIIATEVGGQVRKDAKGNWSDNSEVVANANLLAEAGNVFNETGLTPRQLADKLTAAEASDAESIAMYRRTRDRAQRVACEIEQQRDELLKALKYARRFVDVRDVDTTYTDAIIAKCQEPK